MKRRLLLLLPLAIPSLAVVVLLFGHDPELWDALPRAPASI